MRILLVGLNHKTAPVDIRERLTFTPAMRRSALTHFDSTHSQAHLEDIKEGVILSTCNRLEVYTLVRDPQIAKDSIINFLSDACDTPAEAFTNYLYVYHDEDAIKHLMRVAAGLDSMVLGEPQILGQITDAFEAALSQRAAGTVLAALFRAAIHTGKRVRTETTIGVNPASISSVAANLAKELLGDLSQSQVLLVGAGEMGAVAVKSLINNGVSNITVANRTLKNAEQLAKAWGGNAVPFTQLSKAMSEADIIITSTGAPHTILNKELLKPALTNRSQRPLFIIDIAVPRDVDSDVTDIPGVHLCDIDGLQGQANENVREREAEIPQAEVIVDEEMTKFMEWFCSLDAVSTITTLRQQMEQLRQNELERLFNRIDLDDREKKLVATMSHRLINKILHEPTLTLKKETSNGNGAAYISAVRELFHLDNGTAPK